MKRYILALGLVTAFSFQTLASIPGDIAKKGFNKLTPAEKAYVERLAMGKEPVRNERNYTEWLRMIPKGSEVDKIYEAAQKKIIEDDFGGDAGF